MAKRVIVTCCIVLLFGMVLFVSAQFINGSITKGDVNDDGSINVLDAIETVNIILYPEPPPSVEEICAADCNGDGNVNVLDALGIVNVILGVGECEP